jgi:predicted ester cyclase
MRENYVSLQGNKTTAIESFRVVETEDAASAERIIDPDFVNVEAQDDPDQPERHLKGAPGFLATSRWLRQSFANLSFEILETLAEDDRVVVVAIMHGTHAGEFQSSLPTGKTIQQRQVHLFRLRAGRIVQHQAQRDDLGLLLQIGWRPSDSKACG